MLHYGNDIRLSVIEIRGVGLGLSNVKRYVDLHYGEFTRNEVKGVLPVEPFRRANGH